MSFQILLFLLLLILGYFIGSYLERKHYQSIKQREAEFNKLKSSMTLVGDVKTFENFLVKVPTGVDIAAHSSVIVWCETFGEFITAAKYKP